MQISSQTVTRDKEGEGNLRLVPSLTDDITPPVLAMPVPGTGVTGVVGVPMRAAGPLSTPLAGGEVGTSVTKNEEGDEAGADVSTAWTMSSPHVSCDFDADGCGTGCTDRRACKGSAWAA